MTASTNLDRKVRCLVMLTVPIVIVSAACVIVGILSIWKSAPFYKPPYCIGGAMVAGVVSLISACCIVKFYRVYQGQQSLGISKFESWSKVFFFVWGFMMMASMLGLVTGIWGMLRAEQAIESTETPPTDAPMTRAQYGRQNQDYAIATFVLTFGLSILMIATYYTHKCFEYDYKNNRRDYYDTYFRGSFIHTGRRDLPDFRRYAVAPSASAVSTSNASARDVHSMSYTDGALGEYNIQLTNESSNGRILSVNLTRNHSVSNSVTLPSEINQSFGSHSDSRIFDNTPPPRYDVVCSAPPPSYEEIQEGIARDVALGNGIQLSGIKTSYL